MPRSPRRPRLRPAPPWAVTAGVVCLLAVTSGCSGAERVDVEGFAPGACTDAASTVQDIDETLIGIDEEDLTPEEAGEQLKAAQDVLKPIRDAAEAPRGQTITDLITSLGFFRISVDSNSYDSSKVGDARVALDNLVEQCKVP